MRRIPPATCVLGLLLAGAAMHAVAEVYRWVDAQGRVHYGDRAPADGGARELERLELPSGSVGPDPESAAGRERGRRLLEVWELERQERAGSAAAARRAAAQECERLQAYLRELATARLLYRRGANGRPEYFDAGERRRYEAELRERLARECG